IGMQMVSAVVSREQLRGVARVSHNLVEINHCIEFSAVADPSVHLLPHLFFLRSGKADQRRTEDRVLERWDRSPNDSNPLFVGARYELTIAGYALIEDAQFRLSVALLQPLRKHVGPTPVGIQCGTVAVSERGAKRYDGCPARRSRDIYPG